MGNVARLKALRGRAEENAQALEYNSYPGRGLVVGLANNGDDVVLACWTMGRSGDSRNRVYEETIRHRGGVKTAVADPSRPAKNPELTIYNAMLEQASTGLYVVSNGNQTDDALGVGSLAGFMDSLKSWNYEPDKNRTARITGLVRVTPDSQEARIAVLKQSPHDDSCLRQEFVYPTLAMGVGWCVTTYLGDGDPLPPSEGEPFPLPLLDHPEDIASGLWDCLNEENRVSLAVKVVPIAGGPSIVVLRNKYVKIVP